MSKLGINPYFLYFDEFIPNERKSKFRAFGTTKPKYDFEKVKAKRKMKEKSQKRNRGK